MGKGFLQRQDRSVLIRALFIAGILLFLSELWKQLYLYFIVNDHAYDTWFFPFQLCSVPMYLCILLPFLRKKTQDIILTYLWDYGFFGAVLALVYPEGLIRRHILLTLHGFLWHIVLILIGLLVMLSRLSARSWEMFFRATALFLALCVIATVWNVLLEGRGMAGSYPDMFYLTPYHHTTQPVAREVETVLGRLPARLLYVAALTGLGAVDHAVSRQAAKTKSQI